jgi:tRNA methyl transferase
MWQAPCAWRRERRIVTRCRFGGCPQAQLARVMFPLAPLTKGGVRALAAAAQLPTQARRDSQGICFLGKVTIQCWMLDGGCRSGCWM